MEIAVTMAIILLSICAGLVVLAQTLRVEAPGNFLPSTNHMAKRQFETYALKYTCAWIGAFAVVIATQMYESFTENGYMALCTSLALPFLLQPLLYPLEAESKVPLMLRYSFKANVWIAIFSFIGNYWYTHYFYSVLQAEYKFPAHRLNDVPICLYFATHFYFVTYHTFSNLFLRKIESRYAPSLMRTVFFWAVIVAFSYFTAFMETLTISSFPYYYFPPDVKASVYTKGSAFYGIYFLISFPTFYRLDEKVQPSKGILPHTMVQTVYEAMGCSMMVLLLLDFCRIALNIPLTIAGDAFTVTPLTK
jgi:cycloeucalenol cycloisomerase